MSTIGLVLWIDKGEGEFRKIEFLTSIDDVRAADVEVVQLVNAKSMHPVLGLEVECFDGRTYKKVAP